jgi:hypothetical protein
MVGIWEQSRALQSAAEDTWNKLWDIMNRVSRMDAAITSARAKIEAAEAAAAGQVTEPPPPPAEGEVEVRPSISVSKTGPGSFRVTGSDFLPNARVTVRVADDYGQQVSAPQMPQITSDRAGKIDVPVLLDCIPDSTLHFSATDSRPDPTDIATGVLWSNYVQIPC